MASRRNFRRRAPRQTARLPEIEYRYSALFERTNDAVFILDLKGVHLAVNQQAADLLGYTVDEFVGMPIKQIVGPEDHPDSASKLECLLSGEHLPVYERLFRHKDGHTIPVEINAALVCDPNGRPIHIQSIVRDIREHKQAQEILARRAREMSALNQVMRDIAALQDLDVLLQRIVESAVELTGRPSGGISLYRPERECLEWVIGVGGPLTPIGFTQSQNDGLIGKVWATRQIQVANDYRNWAGKSPRFANESISMIGVPVQYRQVFLGVLVVIDQSMSPFDEQDADLLSQFAVQAAIAIQNARLYEQAQQEIVERKRVEAALNASLHLFQAMEPLSVLEIMQLGLEEGVRLTASEIGFFHLVNPDQKTIRLQTWSKDTLEHCAVSELNQHYPIAQAGVWVDCIHQRRPVIHNDYAGLAHKKGLPEGHTPLCREMVVPLFEQDDIVAVIGVGNKAQDYTQFDIDQLTLLATNTWNIIQQKSTATALRESEQMLRLVFESAFDGISVYEEFSDGRRKLIDCNARYAEIAGRSKEELLALADTISIQTAIDHKIDHQPAAGLEGFETYGGRFSWNRVDGRENIIEYAAVRVRIEERVLVIGVDRDITPQMHAAQERETLIAELEANNAELERFTYTASHDLKSPLITIKSFLGFLEQDIHSGEVGRIKHDISRLTAAANHMQDLLNELLELSRIGRVSNPIQEVVLSALAFEAVEIVAGQLIERDVQVDIAPDLPVVYGDRPRLSQVFQNLVDNAVKYMGDQPHPHIEIGVVQTQRGPATFVRDNGMGIEAQHQEKIFGLFEKLDATSQGTGIGLTIVKRIIEIHGGQVWVESAGNGQGSTFYFTLANISPAYIRRAEP